jgi:DNA-binding SARP family transcriptional activator
LLDRVGERFRVRLTTVVGAAGSGKTTLLGQALTSPADGLDVWYPCALPDRDPQRLLSGVVAAVADTVGARKADLAEPIDALRELMLSALPQHVCLVLDDVHLLGDSGAVAELLLAVPSNGHLLVSGRSLPTLGTARLELLGDLVEIEERDLMLTDDELVAFANARGVDVSILGGANGWPAFVELASIGAPARPRQYLEQESIAHLDEAHRAALAAFAFVGGGDDVLATATTGIGLAELVDGLPLVRWTGDEAQLHDLWVDALSDVLTPDERRSVVSAAAAPLLEHRDFERVVLLGAAVEDWDTVVRALTAAIRDGVDHGMRASQLARWVSMLPPEVARSPAGLLASGVLERDRDPTSQRVVDLLTSAAVGFRSVGDDDLELVALLQLGYVARVSGQPDRLAPVIERVAELAEHFPPAKPYLAFGRAWTALAQGRPDLQLAAMESIVGADLPAVWEQSRDHLLAHALFNLGRPVEGLAVAPGADDSLPIPVPGALMTRSQCLWFSGQPERAICERHGLDGRHGARDRFIAGGWIAVMEAFAGRLDAARAALGVARNHAGELPAMIVAAQVMLIELLIKLVEGDEEEAAADLGAVLEVVPLGGGVSEQTLRTNLALPYVLVPDSRAYWDSIELGPSIRVSREIARAFVEARDGDHRRLASMEFAEPGVVASTLPVAWAIEFALHSLAADRSEGRRLVAWLCEQWGGPARSALQRFATDEFHGSVARDVLSHTPLPPTEPVRIAVLGRSTASIGGYETSDPNWRRERVRALVVWLVVHRGGTREQLAGALWPDLSGERASKNLRTTLNYVHQVLEPRRSSGDAAWFVQLDGSNIRLNPRSEVDAWRFADLLDAADDEQRAGRPTESLPLLLEAVAMYGGDIASDLDHPWLDLERIHLRSRFVRASCRAGDLLTAVGRPSEAIDVLRGSLDADPWHERSYIALADAYDALGDTTSATQVLDLAIEQLGELTSSASVRP